ncbi:hypothetical protein AS026_28635 [Rhizobium altiplani]|uniref:Type I restriction modification DNA specificity domain-containing protein n=1 Tax=Rhizobium altiplani TaxID=1864509 RepID=A0A109K266_9HYPH|nr:restriction endonuclease subunit S [Rhizobium altiplani]KWV59355.1 hypothetical protein AS026_28635 [Rhizobium altiplani]
MTLATWPTYDSYKDSGVEWIGDVPDQWLVEPGRQCLYENRDRNTGMKESTVLSLSYGRVIVKDEDKLTGLVPESFETYQVVQPGDIIIRGTDLQNDTTSLRTGLAKDKGIITSAYINLRPKAEIDPVFLHYLLHSYDVKKVFYALGSGLRQNLSYDDFKYLRLPIPSPPEQRAIVAFLDEKCAKVNEAVRIEEEQIALLRERRQILIHQAVTRGLNPNAPMKDSGIEWIGQIPANWGVVPLKRLFRERNDRSTTGAETLLSLRMNEGLVPHNDVSDKPIGADALKDYKKVFAGQLVMNRMRASIGIFGIVTSSGIVSPDYAIFDIAPRASGDFFLQLFKTGVMGEQFRNASRGLGTGSSGFMRLYTDDFGAISVALPPLTEQGAIVLHINNLSEQIGDAVRLKEGQIAVLKEFKSSLINEAVTGKIKVI